VKILFLNVVKKANVATIAVAFGLWMAENPPCCRRNGDGREHILKPCQGLRKQLVTISVAISRNATNP